MIFQNFGFNRQIVKAAAGPTYNYVSGAKVLFDIGNSSSYPGSGTTVTNLGSAGSASNGTISGGTYSSSNGGILNLTHSGLDKITYTTALSASFTTQCFVKNNFSNTSWGTGGGYYGGIPNIRGNDGFILTGNVDGNTQVLAIIWAGSSANVPSGNFIYPANIGIFHSYTYTSNGSNEHKLYLDTDSPATSTNTYTRGNSGDITSYINYDSANNAAQDISFMGYLQYDRVLTPTEIAQNYAVFSSRF